MGTASTILDANRGLCGSGLYGGNSYDPWDVSKFFCCQFAGRCEYGKGITGISLIWRRRCCGIGNCCDIYIYSI